MGKQPQGKATKMEKWQQKQYASSLVISPMTDFRVGRRKSDSSKWVVAVRVQKKKSLRNVLKERN